MSEGVPADPPHIPDHELLRRIGRGSYGEVWLARNVMGTFRAVKIVHRRHFQDDRPFERELNGIKMFEPISRTHEGLVDILQVGRNAREGYFYSVMELADPLDGDGTIDPETYAPRSLAAVVMARKVLPVEECISYGLTLSSALAHLHEKGLIHRDIKPSNIVFVDGIPKLADIGMVTDAGSASIAGGTLGYLAPEGLPSPRADIYSLGKVLYEISTGKDRQDYPELPTFWSDETDPQRHAELNEVVVRACQRDPARRYQSARELHAELFLLQAGKSVKRLRLLERRMVFLTRVLLVGILVAAVVTLFAYNIYRQRERESKRLADSYAASGDRYAANGDLFGALPWYGAALQQDSGRPDRARRHRQHIESTVRYSPRLMRLYFEKSDIRDLRVHPDGQRLVTALEDGSLVLRDIVTGDVQQILTGHTGAVYAVSWASNGKSLASVGADQTLRLWDLATGQALVLPQNAELRGVTFDHYGTRLAVVGRTIADSRGLLRILNARTGEWIDERVLTHGNIRAAAFSHDDRLLITAGEDGMARLWDGSTLAPVSAPLIHPAANAYPTWIYGVDISPEKAFLATSSFDQLTRLWSMTNLQASIPLRHEAAVRTVEFSPDGQYVLTASDDYTARIFDFHRRVEIVAPMRHNAFLVRATFSPDGSLVITATGNGTIAVWNLAPLEWEPKVPLCVSPGGKRYARITGDSVQVFNAFDDTPLAEPFSVGRPIRDMRFGPGGECLFILSSGKSTTGHGQLLAEVRDINGKPQGAVFELPDFKPEYFAHFVAAVSADGSRAVTVHGKVTRLWDCREGREIGSGFNHPGTETEVAGAALSPDGTRMVSYGESTAFLVDAINGNRIAELPHPHAIETAVFSPNGNLIVTACRDQEEKPRSSRVWDGRSGEFTGHELHHADGVSDAAFTPDGRFLLTAGEDRTIVQWDCSTWKEVSRYHYKSGFRDIAIDEKGQLAVAAAYDDTVHLLSLTPRQADAVPLTPPFRQTWNLGHARFLGDGTRILAKRLGGDRWCHDRGETSASWRHYLGRPSAQVWEWTLLDLRLSTVSAENLHLITRVLPGHQLVGSSMVPLSTDQLQELWTKLRAARLPWFEFHPEDRLRWHASQAERAMFNEQPFAALFHTRHLLKLRPTNNEIAWRCRQLEALMAGDDLPDPTD